MLRRYDSTTQNALTTKSIHIIAYPNAHHHCPRARSQAQNIPLAKLLHGPFPPPPLSYPNRTRTMYVCTNKQPTHLPPISHPLSLPHTHTHNTNVTTSPRTKTRKMELDQRTAQHSTAETSRDGNTMKNQYQNVCMYVCIYVCTSSVDELSQWGIR